MRPATVFSRKEMRGTDIVPEGVKDLFVIMESNENTNKLKRLLQNSWRKSQSESGQIPRLFQFIFV
jgi:hypothetical protein